MENKDSAPEDTAATTGGTHDEESPTPTGTNEKTADKPHPLTLSFSAIALLLSVVSVFVSGFSVYYTRLGVRVGQRAYLSFTPTFPTYKDDPDASERM